MGISLKERFYEAMEALKLTDYRVYTDVEGITKNMMVKLRNGETNEVSTKILMPFLSKYKDVDANYILTGRGTPLREDALNIPQTSGVAITTKEEYEDAKNKGFHLLPQVNFKFSAGQTQLISSTDDITRYWYLPDCKDCEGIAQVVGRSMSPTLPSGCWVALKRYTLPRENPNTIPFGNIFGVVVEDECTGEYHGHIKVFRRYKEQSLASKYWIAHSINTEEFDDFDIEIKQVRSLWIVKQHIVSDTLL